MAYGLRYYSTFDSFQPLLTYTLNIYKKDFAGGSNTILLSGNPAIHEWQEDDPKVPIKGSTLKISILTNSDSGLFITDFYSEDDYGFYCELIRNETGEILFRGYLLQDDSQELQVDFTHEIQLTFTDGLGLLKDVTLDQAAVIVGQEHYEYGVNIQDMAWAGGGPRFASFDSRVSVLKPGDTFRIEYAGSFYYYTCLNVTYDVLFGWIVWVDIPITFPPGTITVDFVYRIPYSLTGYLPLIEIYKLCLKSTFIDTGMRCYTRLYPDGGSSERLLDDTYIQIETFLKNGEWMDCYTILEQINSRFNATLMQAHGLWNLIRWDELYRYTTSGGATLQFHTYSNDFVYTATSNDSQIWYFKKGNDMEVGVLKSINRANQFIKETFNYNENILLQNANLQELGTLINQYEIGTTTYYEYELPYWVNWDGNAGPLFSTRFIRVAYDIDANEIERLIVIKGDVGYPDKALQSNDIFVSAGDKFEFTFDFKSDLSITGGYYVYSAAIITDGVTTYHLNKDGVWQNTPPGPFDRPQFYIQVGDNLNQWHTWTISCFEMPIEAKLNVFLFVPDIYWGTNEMYFKNLQFNIITFLAGWGNINGHEHKDSQSQQIKNNIEKEIFIDQSPRRTISGSLFLDTYTGFLINRTNGWKYPLASYSYQKLGQGTTQEALFTTYKMRAKYEGKLLYINDNDEMLTVLAVFLDNQNASFFRFVPGKMVIDYKTGFADLSLWEMLDSTNFGPGGAGITLQYLDWAASRLYEFNYLYENY